jgi:hypothetical protein
MVAMVQYMAPEQEEVQEQLEAMACPAQLEELEALVYKMIFALVQIFIMQAAAVVPLTLARVVLVVMAAAGLVLIIWWLRLE